MGVGNNNRKVMTLGWRLETEQLGYCTETADFCTGSNHCWLQTLNPCLYFFLSFFRPQRKAPEASPDSHSFSPSPATPRRVCASRAGGEGDPEGLFCSCAAAPMGHGTQGHKVSLESTFGLRFTAVHSEPGIWPSASHWLCGLVPRYPSLRRNFWF